MQSSTNSAPGMGRLRHGLQIALRQQHAAGGFNVRGKNSGGLLRRNNLGGG